MNIKRYLHTHSHVHKTHCNESTTGPDASVKAQTHEAQLAWLCTQPCGAIEWEMIDTIVAKKDVKSSKVHNTPCKNSYYGTVYFGSVNHYVM